MRSLLAVLAGYLIFAVCSFALFPITGHDPHAEASLGYKVLVVGCGMLFAFAGGYVAARIARTSPLAHGVVLAIVLAAIAAWSLHASPTGSATWTQTWAIVAMAPSGFLGSLVRSIQLGSTRQRRVL